MKIRKPKVKESTVKDGAKALGDMHGVKLYNNAVGTFPNPRGGYFRYGLGPGTGDKIGFKSVVITPDMVGLTVAIFCSVELKATDGILKEHQREHLEEVNAAGGIAFVARSVERIYEVLHADGWRRWFGLK